MRKLLVTITITFLMALPLYGIQEVSIPSGSTGKSIVSKLKNEGIINYETPFYIYLKLSGQVNKLRAGTFLLDPSYSYRKLASILQEKEGAASLTKVTIPEGYSIIEIANELGKHNVIKDNTEFIFYVEKKAKNDFADDFPFLHEFNEETLEGYLFPNTYIFAKGSSFKSIVRTFLNEFQRTILPIYENHFESKLTLHQTITLASIIERESQVKSEMTLISGVFHNRLKKGIPLAACPTVGYAIGNPRKKIITFKDLKNPSPYNTYKYKGLPPTAIASPGKLAIIASLNPDTTNLLYFVANGDGSHTFSKTYKEHLRHQRRILSKKN